MFGIGFGEMLVIGVFALLAVGPDKLPGMIKTVAKTYRQLRRTADDLRQSTGIDDLLRDEELRELASFRKQKLLDLNALTKPAPQKLVAAKGGPSHPSSDEHPPEGIDVFEARHRLAEEIAKREALNVAAQNKGESQHG